MEVIQLAGFVPDADEYAPGAMLEASNVVPTVRGMAGAPTQVSAGYSALADTCIGAALVAKNDGTYRSFAGTTSNLYEGGGGTWTSRGSGYSASSDTRWRWAQFGDATIAVQKANRPQVSTSTTFSDLYDGGLAYAPKSAIVEVANAFVFMANCNDTGAGLGTSYGDQPHRIWWSAYGDYTDWTPAVSTQAGTGLLIDVAGPITAVKAFGRDVVVYKEAGMWLGEYVFPDASIWRFTLIPGDIGAWSHECVVNIGSAHLFIGRDDFYLFDGSRPQPIGAGVRDWFFSNLNKAYAYKIWALHDVIEGNVWWFYPSTSSTTLNKAIVYNYRSQRWGTVDMDVEAIVTMVTDQLTYDNLGTLFATYDDFYNIPYDSPFWSSASRVVSVFDDTHTAQYLSGTSGTSSFRLAEFGDDEAVTMIRRVRPRWMTAPENGTLDPYYRWTAAGSANSGPDTALAGDKFDLFQTGRWHRLNFSLSGNWESNAIAIDRVGVGSE